MPMGCKDVSESRILMTQEAQIYYGHRLGRRLGRNVYTDSQNVHSQHCSMQKISKPYVGLFSKIPSLFCGLFAFSMKVYEG